MVGRREGQGVRDRVAPPHEAPRVGSDVRQSIPARHHQEVLNAAIGAVIRALPWLKQIDPMAATVATPSHTGLATGIHKGSVTYFQCCQREYRRAAGRR